ncbi:hypothetical protein EYC80_002078 [Monilinia laxa]|uniref:Uncharacterized protein n=1 Tax=Monilinia laxa TaxID=61186 RepID=A0A5N6K6Z8_MONLA|nr:hypothetical protein EYC80_002078 [Monilinia laxa]
MAHSNPQTPVRAGGCSNLKNVTPDIESLYKIDAAMAISQAELGNTIISCRGVLSEKRASDMTDKQREVFEETVRLIDSAHGIVSSPRLSQLDTEFTSQVDPEALTDHTNRLLGSKSIEEILHKSQRYLKLKEELSGLRTWWATAIVKYKTELIKCSRASTGIDQRLKKIAVLEKAAGRIETEAERTAEAEAKVLIRRVKRMKTDLFNALEKFTATRKYMRSAQVRFKAIRDTVRQIEGGIQEPPSYDSSQRPLDFNYEYHLPEKRAVDTQWWISKGFSWWANLAYSHLVQTNTNLEEAIHKCQSRQARRESEASNLEHQLNKITEKRDEEIKLVQGFDKKNVSNNIRLRNRYFQARRRIATTNDQIVEVRGRLSAYELDLVKLQFTEFIHKLMISLHTAVKNILGHALADQQLDAGIYNELSLQYVHAMVCLARKSMRAAIDIMTDVDSDLLTKEDMDYLEGVSNEQGDDKKDRENRDDLWKLRNAGIVFVTSRQRNGLLEDAFEASLSENQKIVWLSKITNGLQNDRKSTLSKEGLYESSGSIKTADIAKAMLRTDGELELVDVTPKYILSMASRDCKEDHLLLQMAQLLADFFRSPDISHHFRPDGWVFELHDLFCLVELAIEDPPTKEEFAYFFGYCNDIEELFNTNFRTQKVTKQKVGWELVDEAQINGPERVKSIWNAPAGFEQATDFMIANGSDLYSDMNRDISIEALREKWNHLAAYHVSRAGFQSYIDTWHDCGTFIVILRLELDGGLLLRFIDNGWQHLQDMPHIILPYPPITFIPPFWLEVWKLMMEPQVASIWKPKVRSGQISTVTEFYIELRGAIEKVSDVVRPGFWELWVPEFVKGRKVHLTLYKFWLFLRTMANEPGPVIVLDRKGQRIHGNRLGDDKVTNRLSNQWGP